MLNHPLCRAALCAALLSAGHAQAQTDTLYVTDGDSARLAIVRGGVLQSVVSTHVRGYPLTVTGSIWIGDYNGAQLNAIEYSLAGSPTGNTVPYTVVDAVDGATDGTRSWQLGNAFTGSANVMVSPSVDFQGSSLAFTVSGSDLVGIAFDTATQTLWISDASTIYHYTTTGTLLGQFAHSSGRGTLAYEPSTDTLWYVTNNSNNITQYSKTGTLLQTLSIAGLSSNNWGAEFAAGGRFVAHAAPVPAASPGMLAAAAALIVAFGISILRRSAGG